MSRPPSVSERNYFLVDTVDVLKAAVEDLSSYNTIAFDAEGEDLGRTGPLTIASFGGIGVDSTNSNSPIYIVDVKKLGGDTVFPKASTTASSSLRSILEDPRVKIITFDCRGDSDALYHQFEVKLDGSWDLQVVDQAIRIHEGQRPPEKCEYVKVGKTFTVPGMDISAARLGLTVRKLPKPHVFRHNIWAERPLDEKTLEYAAHDIQVIIEMAKAASKINLSSQLQAAIERGCRRYETLFRDCSEDNMPTLADRREEHPIISEEELPPTHPRLPGNHMLKGRQKRDDTVKKLKEYDSSNMNALYNNVMFILQHDDWYTDSAFVYVRGLCRNYPYFTQKQRQQIQSPPKLRRYDDDEYDPYDYDDYDYYWTLSSSSCRSKMNMSTGCNTKKKINKSSMACQQFLRCIHSIVAVWCCSVVVDLWLLFVDSVSTAFGFVFFPFAWLVKVVGWFINFTHRFQS